MKEFYNLQAFVGGCLRLLPCEQNIGSSVDFKIGLTSKCRNSLVCRVVHTTHSDFSVCQVMQRVVFRSRLLKSVYLQHAVVLSKLHMLVESHQAFLRKRQLPVQSIFSTMRWHPRFLLSEVTQQESFQLFARTYRFKLFHSFPLLRYLRIYP